MCYWAMPNSTERLIISHIILCSTKPSGLWLCNLLIICPTKGRHALNESETSVVSIYIQKIRIFTF